MFVLQSSHLLLWHTNNVSSFVEYLAFVMYITQCRIYKHKHTRHTVYKYNWRFERSDVISDQHNEHWTMNLLPPQGHHRDRSFDSLSSSYALRAMEPVSMHAHTPWLGKHNNDYMCINVQLFPFCSPGVRPPQRAAPPTVRAQLQRPRCLHRSFLPNLQSAARRKRWPAERMRVPRVN